MTAARPTAPAPKTATVSPGPAPKEWRTAPAPVRKPQPSGPSSSRGREASTRTAFRAGTIAYSANEDWPNHRGASASPAPSVNRAALSARPPKRLSAANRSQ